MVGVSAWLAVDKASFFDRLQIHNLTEEQHEEFRTVSVVDYGAYILVGVGAAIMLQSLIGTIGTLMGCCGNKQARCCLITYGLLVLAVIVIEIVAAVLVLYVYQGAVETEVEAFMNSTIEREYRQDNPTAVTVLWDHMMTQLECCGVQDYTDFTNQVPPSCCSSANFTCPDLSLNPTAVLPQVEPCLAGTQLVLTFSDGVWLLLCTGGGHSACSCSLSCSGRCFPVGRGTACLLPGKDGCHREEGMV